MQTIPTFRSEGDAARFAEVHQLFRKSLSAPNGPDYALRYGMNAAKAAENCRKAALKNDLRSLHVNTIALSICLSDPRAKAA